MANYLHSTPTPLDVDPPLAPHGGRPRVWLRRPPRSAPLTSSDSQLCEHGVGEREKEREGENFCLLTVQVLSPSFARSVARSPVPNSIISTLVTHIHPVLVGKLGGELSHVVCYACVLMCGPSCRGKFIRRGEFA